MRKSFCMELNSRSHTGKVGMKLHKVTQFSSYKHESSLLINLAFPWISLQSKEICHLFSINMWIYKLLFKKKKNCSEGKWIFSFGNLLLLCWILHLCQTGTVIHQSTIKLKRTITTHKDCPLACTDNYKTGTLFTAQTTTTTTTTTKQILSTQVPLEPENECLCSHRSSNECLTVHMDL